MANVAGVSFLSRFSNDAWRERTSAHFEAALGASPVVARLGAVAAHPLDDGVKPGRELAAVLRELARGFNQQAKRIDSADGLRTAARSTIQRCHVAARCLGNAHYEHAFEHVLRWSAREGETWNEVFGDEAALAAELGLPHPLRGASPGGQ